MEYEIDPKQLEAIRNLYDVVLHWYDNADAKARVLLTLNGALVSFLTSSIFIKTNDLREILAGISPITLFLLGSMAILMAASIVLSLACMWSRVKPPEEIQSLLSDAKQSGNVDELYDSRLVMFFGHIKDLQLDRFRRTLLSLNTEEEVKALAFQILQVSKNVFKKHSFVNIGFVSFGFSLLAFLCAGVIYIYDTLFRLSLV
ncbi:MAG: hypothetical protein GTO14_00200 [Anaerolineales bacterium]|nr:hypothetical protein [Anaerolineales bacterium]